MSNHPDGWEQRAIEAITLGKAKFVDDIANLEGKHTYRFLSELPHGLRCAECGGNLPIGGADEMAPFISIGFDITEPLDAFEAQSLIRGGAVTVVFAALLVLLHLLTRRLGNDVERANARSREARGSKRPPAFSPAAERRSREKQSLPPATAPCGKAPAPRPSQSMARHRP